MRQPIVFSAFVQPCFSGLNTLLFIRLWPSHVFPAFGPRLVSCTYFINFPAIIPSLFEGPKLFVLGAGFLAPMSIGFLRIDLNPDFITQMTIGVQQHIFVVPSLAKSGFRWIDCLPSRREVRKIDMRCG
jgi:hypothetical protein